MNDSDGIRLWEFCQFKKEIRGSTEYLIVGLDIGKERHNAFFGTATGKTLHKGMFFDNTYDGFQKLLIQTDALKVQYGLRKVVFGLEPTANYHKPLGEYLIKGGHLVVLIAAAATVKNRELLDGRWDKHDTKDSANVADLISQAKCLYYDCPGEELRSLRGLLSLKRRLKKEEHGLRVRIRNQLLAQYFPEMDQHFGSAASLNVVSRCLDPSLISLMEYDEFCRTVSPGKVNLAQQKRLTEIWRAAKQSIGCIVGQAVSVEAQIMVAALHRVRETIKTLEDKIEEICLKFPEYSFLITIPGFGPDVSSKVLAAIGDPERFTNGTQVLKMAGLDLCADRSGKRSNSAIPVISKHGKSGLRYALYQAALISSLNDKDFIVYHTNKIRGREREKGIHTKMRVKLAAKLLIIAWTLMKKKEPFDPKYLNQGDSKV
ncbi:MAG TPA: IS110 family transposase [Nitrospirota bacterium]|nr:IS110 family transposase [Nitrospirota bacterium]